MSVPSASLQAFVRRGGVLQGQRLIFAVVAVVLLLFYFSSSSVSHRGADASHRLTPASGPAPGDRDIIAEELRKEPEPESLADKFFDYLVRQPAKSSKSAAAPAATPSVAPYSNPESSGDPVCGVLAKGTKDLLVVVKTQASNLYNHLPSRVLTNLRCAPLVLFSTVSHKIGSFVVHDALSDIAPETREKHKEFELYLKLQNAQKSYLDLSQMHEDGNHNLEKWSVIPSLVSAYRMHPYKKWFVLIQDDTYLSLPNLLSWLGQLDATQPFYAGTRVEHDGLAYASSGEGIVLSNAAAAALAGLYDNRRGAWENATAGQHCCGDAALGAALGEARVALVPARAHTQADSPLTAEWSPHAASWCRAPVTWNRMTPQLMDALWRFERNWTLSFERRAPPEATSTGLRQLTTATATETPTGTATSGPAPPARAAQSAAAGTTPWTSSLGIPPMLHRDIFAGLVLPLLRATSNLTDWDNGSSALELTDKSAASSFGHSSFETCKYACDIRGKCVQWLHERNSCRMGNTVRIGGPAANRDNGEVVSGWLAHRAKALLVDGPACGDVEAFVVPELPRPEVAAEAERKAVEQS